MTTQTVSKNLFSFDNYRRTHNNAVVLVKREKGSTIENDVLQTVEIQLENQQYFTQEDSPCVTIDPSYYRNRDHSIYTISKTHNNMRLNIAKIALAELAPQIVEEGLIADHISGECRGDCINLNHLQALTQQENSRKRHRVQRSAYLLNKTPEQMEADRRKTKAYEERNKKRSNNAIFADLQRLHPDFHIPCAVCDEAKHYREFWVSRKRRSGRVSTCRECSLQRNAERRLQKASEAAHKENNEVQPDTARETTTS